MIYEARNHWFIWNGVKIELTNKEHIFITHLRYGEVVTYEELSLAIYGVTADEFTKHTIRHTKMNILKKIPLKIKTVKGKGYMLKTEILFC